MSISPRAQNRGDDCAPSAWRGVALYPTTKSPQRTLRYAQGKPGRGDSPSAGRGDKSPMHGPRQPAALGLVLAGVAPDPRFIHTVVFCLRPTLTTTRVLLQKRDQRLQIGKAATLAGVTTFERLPPSRVSSHRRSATGAACMRGNGAARSSSLFSVTKPFGSYVPKGLRVCAHRRRFKFHAARPADRRDIAPLRPPRTRRRGCTPRLARWQHPIGR